MDLPLYTPTLLALRLSDEPELQEGNTGPLKLECAPIDDLMNPAVYVVKFHSSVARNGLGIISEIIAGHLANYFGIAVPEFALIEVSNAFAQSTNSNLHTPDHILTIINQNIHNYNFGSKLVSSDTKSPMSVQIPTSDQIDMAEKIFAFDALIYNADRTTEWPNVFASHDSYIVYDHEKSFNFLFDSRMQPPTEINFCTLGGEMFLTKHVFRTILQGRQLTFDNFVSMLENLDDIIIDGILKQIPYNLRKGHTKEINAIGTYLKTVKEKSNEFRYGVMRVLV